MCFDCGQPVALNGGTEGQSVAASLQGRIDDVGLH